MRPNSERGISSKRFTVIFVGLLVLLLLAFAGMVRWAMVTLPQEDEVVGAEEAARLIESNRIERILIQEERDVFLYRAGEPRPIYMQLGLGETFTQTMEAAGVTAAEFPPLTVEEE